MRRTLLAAALLALAVPTMGRADDADAEKQVGMLSKQYREAVVKGDTNAMDSILADDWVGINLAGDVESKAEQVKNLKDGSVDFEAIDPESVKVRVYGDAAVVMGSYHVKLTYNGQKSEILVRNTEVFARQGGQWQCVSTQVTSIAGQSGEAANARAEAAAAKSAPPKPRQQAMITFAIHGYEGVNEALEFGPLKAEFEKRGYSCKIVRSPRTKTKTPNQDRAKVMVEALKNVESDIVLVGISNQGLFMPLVAAERPIRRIVMINAVVPTPGKSFREAFDFKEVFANGGVRLFAQIAPGMSEVCPLKELPKVEYVYVCGEKDDAIRPEWEQRAAREYLHVEPVVVKGAGHANIVLYVKYVKEVVDAATKGL